MRRTSPGRAASGPTCNAIPTGRLYLNFAGHGEDAGFVRQAVGAGTYARLVEVKRKYDPTNFFRINQNIPPG